VMHGRAAQRTAAEATQVLGADMCLMRQLVERPVMADIRGDAFPDAVQTVIHLPGLRETLNVMLDQLDPMKHGGRLGLMARLLDESVDGVPQRRANKRCHQRRAAAQDRRLPRLLLVAHPAAAPDLARHGMERVHHERRQRHGHARAAFLPRTIHQHASFPFQAGEKVQAALMHAHDAVGRTRRHHACMRDAMRAQRAAHRRTAQPGPAVALRTTHHAVLRVRPVRVRFG